MYFQLTGALKRRFVKELRDFWATHPKYKDIVDNIQGKYSFKERPQHGIIVKTGSANKVDLSADNYIGIVTSYVFLAKYKRYPGHSIEWVREDNQAIQENGGAFPCPPGIYYVGVETDPDDSNFLAFYVDPLLDIYHEQIVPVGTQAILANAPVAGTLRLYEMPAAYMLIEGVNYTLVLDGSGKPTGEITLNQALTGGRYLSADYRYPATSTGPWRIHPGFANNQAIPGCVLAFGNRAELNDRLAVVIQDVRRPAAMEYGGRWSLTLDFDVTSRDVYAQQEIADQSVIYLWGVLRPRLSTEGLEMMDISMGGESEEIYDETGDDYYYNSSFNLTVETEWSIHVPLPIFLRSVTDLTVDQSRAMASLSDEDAAAIQSNIRVLDSLDLEAVADPYYTGRTDTYETMR
ncbi:MAG: hypothetical protein WC824_07975 [Bacteroidota bacterium]